MTTVRQSGYTILELMVVLGLLALLIGFGISSIGAQFSQVQDLETTKFELQDAVQIADRASYLVLTNTQNADFSYTETYYNTGNAFQGVADLNTTMGTGLATVSPFGTPYQFRIGTAGVEARVTIPGEFNMLWAVSVYDAVTDSTTLTVGPKSQPNDQVTRYAIMQKASEHNEGRP